MSTSTFTYPELKDTEEEGKAKGSQVLPPVLMPSKDHLFKVYDQAGRQLVQTNNAYIIQNQAMRCCGGLEKKAPGTKLTVQYL
jgi:hypothetical protein